MRFKALLYYPTLFTVLFSISVTGLSANESLPTPAPSHLTQEESKGESIAFEEAKAEIKPTKEELEAEAIDAEQAKELQAFAVNLVQPPTDDNKKRSKAVAKIPVYSNKKIERFIVMYTVKKRDVFEAAVKRSAKYMPMINRIFKEEGLPPNLAYLAVVESNLNPVARSHANAIGLWQFMRRTGRYYKLNSSWWHDDRFDPEKSTRAAAQYLKQLYNQFGEWELALSAYNAGAGRVRRAIRKANRKHKNTDYWAIDLPRETRGYVPTFYAVNILFENLESYGFSPPPADEAEWEREFIDVPGGISIEAIAKVIKVDQKDLAELNPHLHKGITPANLKSVDFAVPPGTVVDHAALKRLENNRQKFWKNHRVRNGDTLWAIANKYRIPLRQIVAFNRLNKRRSLRIGQRIMLPVASNWATPKRHKQYAKSKRAKQKARNKQYHYHKVRSGESFYSIASKYQTSVRKVKKWNRRLARKRFLKIGSYVALRRQDVPVLRKAL